MTEQSDKPSVDQAIRFAIRVLEADAADLESHGRSSADERLAVRNLLAALAGPLEQPQLWQWRKKGEPWTLERTFTFEVFATTADSEVRPLFATANSEQPDSSYSVSPVPSEGAKTALLEFISHLQAFADNEYVRGCHVSRRTECLGYEAKIKQGKFGEAEYQAHKEMDMHMGAHFGIYKAIAAARAAVGELSGAVPSNKPASAPESSALEILRELVALKDSGDELRQNSRGLNAHAADELAAEYGKRLAGAWDRARASLSVPKEQQ